MSVTPTHARGIASTVLVAFLSATNASAQTVIDWTAGGATDSYGNVFNWDGLNIPNTTTESARFDLAGAYDVTLASGVTTTVSDLIVSDGDINFAAGSSVFAIYEVDDDLLVRSGASFTVSRTGGSGNVVMTVADTTDVGGVSGTSSLRVDNGSSLETTSLFVGRNSNGTADAVIDGASLDVLGSAILGSSGSTGTLTFQNGGGMSEIVGTTTLVSGSVAGTRGRLNVLFGSALNTGNLRVGSLSTSASAAQEATVTVDGFGAKLTQTGAATLTVGDATNPNVDSTVKVSDGGIFSTGTGATLIQNTGSLSVTNATFNANGTFTMTAGTTLRLDGGAFNAAVGLDNSGGGSIDHVDGFLTVTGGVFAPNAGGPTDHYTVDAPGLTDAPHLRLGAGATSTIGGDLRIGNDIRGEMTLSDGADLIVNSVTYIGREAGATGTVTVKDSGTTWANPNAAIVIGHDGTGTLDVTDGADVFPQFATIGNLAGSNGALTVNGIGTDWTSTSGMTVGRSGTGTLDILAGGDVSNTTSSMGVFTGSSGTVTVDGTGSSWVGTADMFVGQSGEGTLNITGGAFVSTRDAFIALNSGSIGEVTVSGFGSAWSASEDITVGGGIAAGGTGTLSVETGALVSSSNEIKVWPDGTVNHTGGDIAAGSQFFSPVGQGVTVYSDGEIDVAGGSWNSGSNLTVDGVVSLTDGGSMSGHDVFIGFSLGSIGSSVTVSGPVSTWDNTGTVLVGLFGQGTLTVEAGGASLSDFGVIGEKAGSFGVATVTGAGSIWEVASDLIVGNFGDGTLNVSAGGVVSSFRGFIGSSTGSDGDVTVSGVGSSLQHTGDLYVGGNDVAAEGSGLLTIHSGGHTGVGGELKLWSSGTVNLQGGSLTADAIDDTDGGSFNFTGGTLSVNHYLGTLNQSGGTLTPGQSPGITVIDDNYNLSAGTLLLEIGGTAAGTEHDRVEVFGFADLLGTLEVVLINGFTPSAGDSFAILSGVGGFNSAFSSLVLPDLSGLGLDWQLNPSGATLFLDVINAALVGDLDGDGFVGIADLNIVLGNWNQTVPPGDPLADPTGDGFVGIADLNVVLGNWNAGTPPGADTVIPEPAAVGLFGVLSVGVLGRRRTAC